MSKLLKFKECVSLDEAAKRISQLIGEPIKAEELVEFAINGHLHLSVLAENWLAFREHVKQSEKFEIKIIQIGPYPDAYLSGLYRLADIEREIELSGGYPQSESQHVDGLSEEGVIVIAEDGENYRCYEAPSVAIPLESTPIVESMDNDTKKPNEYFSELLLRKLEEALGAEQPDYPLVRPPLELVMQSSDLLDFVNKVNGTTIQSKPLAPKTKNKYLSTIKALSEALIRGLTNEPGKDAAAILKQLELSGVAAPIEAKTLAKYLSEANQLTD